MADKMTRSAVDNGLARSAGQISRNSKGTHLFLGSAFAVVKPGNSRNSKQPIDAAGELRGGGGGSAIQVRIYCHVPVILLFLPLPSQLACSTDETCFNSREIEVF